MTRTDKAYLVGIHRYSFRAGEPAEILSVSMVANSEGEFRPCYHIQFSDGETDYTCIEDYKNYKIIGFKDILAGDLPAVTE